MEEIKYKLNLSRLRKNDMIWYRGLYNKIISNNKIDTIFTNFNPINKGDLYKKDFINYSEDIKYLHTLYPLIIRILSLGLLIRYNRSKYLYEENYNIDE